MRFLFTTLPGTSHALPWISLAQAAQAAGHDVLAAVSGPALETAADAGLLAVATDDGAARASYHRLADMLAEGGSGMEIGGDRMARFVSSVFADTSAAMMDGLLAAATAWRPDLIVYTPPLVAGLVTARLLGVPAVMHGLGTPLPTPPPALAAFAAEAERRGVPDLTGQRPDVEIDVSPPSLDAFAPPRPPGSRGLVLPMRFTAYTGGSHLPDWLLRRSDRPRVVVTLGSFTQWFRDGGLMREVVLGTRDLGVDLVVATAGADLPALPDPLPEHVTLVDWVPMRALLAVSDAIVHHGGLGTVYAAFAAGVPQLVLPAAAGPALANSRTVAARGAGAVLDMDGAVATALKPAVEDVLVNPAYREAAQEVAAEMAAMPSPADVAGRLAEFTSAHRRYQRPLPRERAVRDRSDERK
ncbi:nucleotide disphospho-sugar-binding domain-containing protein [Actinoplanes sp. NBRC 103695]|uniref:nucleotide disphospho-sugar-binding domain-containing protein n=1 Tax=Actinoplanes sp. NBRC 103695 TaxID=3032202 RepID=UPI002557329E|nr:nucleotide disphospho-sugar-binding domain-containing protein [Actinoplanes sp. NBRC 103695]